MKKSHQFRHLLAGVPPWLLMGAVAVLLPLFAVMTLENIHRQRQQSIRMLKEKGAALIRSFEAGTRTGMMRMDGRGFRLQRLLTETAQQPDIVYLLVSDLEGTVFAHNRMDQIGARYGADLDLEKINRSQELHWRQLTLADGARVFEVFQKFMPTGPPKGRPSHAMRHHGPEGGRMMTAGPGLDLAQIIFVGLDMTPVVEAERVDIRHTIIMGVILMLIGFGGIVFVFGAARYRDTQASLARIKAFSDKLVEHMPMGLLALDMHKQVTALNQAAEGLLGLAQKGVLGLAVDGRFPPQLRLLIEGMQPADGIVEREMDCALSADRHIPMQVCATAFADEQQNLLGYVLLFRDLSEVKALQREIAISQRLAAIGRLAAGVAHEIRNPLSSIKGFATYFRERYHDVPDDQQTASIMIQEVDRLNRVVGQLLDFARPITLVARKTLLETFIGNSLKLIAPQAAERDIVVKLHCERPGVEARVDPDRMQQVMLNLYLNALEAMPGGGQLTVAVTGNDRPGGVEIMVCDSGRGIPEDALSHVFDPYFTTKSSGTGLGLAIARNIVEAHHGTIHLERRKGGGTCARIRLP